LKEELLAHVLPAAAALSSHSHHPVSVAIAQGLVAQGVGIWIGFQAFINMGVNLGALPTKGLTLPLMSYGGSAIMINLVAIAMVLRVDFENRQLMHGGRR